MSKQTQTPIQSETKLARVAAGHDPMSAIKAFASRREVSLAIVLILLCVAIGIKSPTFFNITNITDILKNNSVIMIMSIGMLCVLLTGGIDISITGTSAFCGMSVGMLIKYNFVTNTLLSFVIATAMGLILGTIIGLVISRGRVLPIIATLGFMFINRALAYLVARDQWAGADALGDFKDFALDDIFGINNVIFVMLLIYILFFFIMKWTPLGRKFYAVGSNEEAALVSGINTANVKLLAYMIMGTLSGLGGALSVSVYASAQPNMMLSKEMDVIAACVIGGVSMNGGRGTVLGTLLGSIILAIIAKALPLVGIESIAQNTVKGFIILVVVILNVLTQRTMDKNNLKAREL